jgi:pimeloyl-ACP methyl ester carboxylesterase
VSGPRDLELRAKAHPDYLPVRGGAFSLWHAPRGRATGLGVVLVPPYGWEEVASYRARALWADALAQDGHAVVRLDLPATGDSAGDPGDDDLLGAWRAAVAAAADGLRAAGCRRVALIGIGVGGLVAATALAAGARAEDVVLWNVPDSGRRAVRSLRAFARLQDADEPSDLPDGWLEVGGALAGAGLLEQLSEVDLAADLPLEGVERVLLLEADHRALAQRLEDAGIAVRHSPGPGYADMVDHPQFLAPPTETIALVGEWLKAVPVPPEGAAAVAGDVEPRPGVLVDERWRERPRWFDVGGEALFGVLTEPVAPSEPSLCVVLLNAGALRRTGPNGLWVQAARRFAADGLRVVRVDLPGIGDAFGDAGVFAETAGFYRPELVRQVGGLLDELEREGLGSRFVLAGLCSGAYHAFVTGATDPRVVAVGALNPRLLHFDDARVEELRRQRMGERLNLGRARDLVMGRVSRAAVRRAVAEARVLVRQRLRRDGPSQAASAALPDARGSFDALARRGVPTLLAFSGDEPLPAQLVEQGLAPLQARWGDVRQVALPGKNHELRSRVARQAAFAALAELVTAARARTSVGGPAAAGGQEREPQGEQPERA